MCAFILAILTMLLCIYIVAFNSYKGDIHMYKISRKLKLNIHVD